MYLVEIIMSVVPHTPIHIAKICRYSSCVFLVPGTLNFYIGYPINGIVMYMLFLTSQLHWNYPVDKSLYYKLDKLCILLAVLVSGTNVALHFAPIYSLYYWSGMIMAHFMFLHSYHIYNKKIIVHKSHKYTGTINAKRIIQNFTDYSFAPANTAEREEAHYTVSLIHAIGVHFMAALTATTLCIIKATE